MTSQSAEVLVQDAILEFSMGDSEKALTLLDEAIATNAQHFNAHLSKAEVLYAEERYKEALTCAEHAESLDQNDVHLMTTLSRVWMQLGDKEKAEHYGAQAKMMGWKKQLQEEPSQNGLPNA